MQFSVDDYYPPEWSSMPIHKYYFQIIKEGNLLGKLQVKHKEFNLVGRLEDLCDVYINNPLVSRKHAILQAKKNDHHLYLMDLGSQHGSFVNKTQMPAHTYKKLQPFDSIKFGVSSRVYILRCPEYQEHLQQEQNLKENQFTKLLEEQHRKLSKEEMKAKYVDMLENDPYFAANQAPRKLLGKQQVVEEEEDQYAGIDWGITDQKEVYGYKNQAEFPIEPDLLRRLNLDSNQLSKLAEYEDVLRNYQEVESELNELTSKEKREFGLQEKLRAKKQKWQKKFVESLQSLQKIEDWLRGSIFGDIADRNKKNANTIRQRQNDTFGDDVFLDRTLEKKEERMDKNQEVEDVEVYWVLQAKLKSQIVEHKQMTKKLNQEFAEDKQVDQDPSKVEDEQDEFDLFMKQNQKQADCSNKLLLQRELLALETSITELKVKLIGMVGQGQVNQLLNQAVSEEKKTLQQSFLEKSMEQNAKNALKKKQLNKNLDEILNKLQRNQQEQDLDEQKVQIFKYYKEEPQEEHQDLDQEETLNRLRNKRTNYDPSAFEKPMQKIRRNNELQAVPVEFEPNEDFVQQQVIDLTKAK